MNAGKTLELAALVHGWGDVEVLDLRAFPTVALPPEDGATYAENAAAKAVAVARATGIVALADDSGLEVDALGGAPGLRSARFAPTDAERVGKLLAALGDVPPGQRTARFRCVVALASPTGDIVTAEGTCEGRILDAPRGAGGFGYDPVFQPDGFAESFAEFPPRTKDAISHRARAVSALGYLLARA